MTKLSLTSSQSQTGSDANWGLIGDGIDAVEGLFG